MIIPVIDTLIGNITKHTSGLCAVTDSQHHAANILSSNKPVIAVGDPTISIEAEYIGGNLETELEIEIWIIHPHSEDNKLAHRFFSETIPVLAFLGAEKFEPVNIPIQGTQYPGYRTTLTRSHTIEG